MFNNMKNKIREKTGTELPKFTANSAAAAASSLFGKKSNQHSRQSSQGSIYSIVSDSDVKDENEPKALRSVVAKMVNSDDVKTIEDNESKVDDTAAPIAAADAAVSKLAEKEREWLEREKQYVSDLSKQTKELQEALSIVSEHKTKLEHCREEKEQLEAYQKQEVAKIKQLLLAKEEENKSSLSALKEALASIESLKLEVDRLRPLEERMNTCQATINDADEEDARERDRVRFQELTDRLQVLMKENEALRLSNEESRRIYDESLSKEWNKNGALEVEIGRLKEYSVELAVALQREKDVKDQTLLRNAEISQLVQLAEQELKQQQVQNEESFRKMASLEEQLEITRQNLEQIRTQGNTITITNERKLSEKIKELENEIADKNKSIRILQQNLNDVKKTFQDELKNNTPPAAVPAAATGIVNADATATATNCSTFLNHDYNGGAEDDINFKYMKHVLIKFLTSSEYEAQQLTKAVATLLKLNSEEERLIKDTLEWRSSWFGSKPRVKLHYNPS